MNRQSIIGKLFFLILLPVSVTINGASQDPAEVVILDEKIKNKEIIINSLRPGIHVIELRNGKDQFDQLNHELSTMKNLRAIHLLLCGKEGMIMLDGKPMVNGNLCDSFDELSQWKNSFGEDGDILIYTCDLAQKDHGKLLTRRLSSITGLDVAASVNPTGNDAVAADWNLEFMVGRVETDHCFDPEKILDYPGKLQRNGSN